MKNIFLMLCSLLLLSCSKTNTDPTNGSASGSISYKVNGTLITIDNANIANGEGVAFAKQLQGSFIPVTRYILNGQKGINNLIGFTIITDTLRLIGYHYDSSLVNNDLSKYSFTFDYNGQIAGLFFNGDYFDVSITSYKNSRISGTFSAKFTPMTAIGSGGIDYDSRGSVLLTEGKLNNVQVIY